MNNLGIIVEYNPFHNGHKIHIEQSKKITSADNIFAVMSGNFVQRGTPAILNKYQRTRQALENGVDIVFELPTIYATSSAELFSYAAISILDKTNIIDCLCFGSELGAIDLLKDISSILIREPLEYKNDLKSNLSNGLNFPKSRELAIGKINTTYAKILSQPNNILGVEYLKALYNIQSKIIPYTINRKVANYHDLTFTSPTVASATSIRNKLDTLKNNENLKSLKQYVPYGIYEDLENALTNATLPKYDIYFLMLKYKILTTDKNELLKINDINGNILSTMHSCLAISKTYNDYLESVCSKCYTKTRIQRIFSNILLNIKSQDIEKYKQIDFIPYIRVLGFRREKSYLLKQLQDNSSVPIVLNLKNANINVLGNSMLQDESRYTNIYNLITNNNDNCYNNIHLSDCNYEKKQPLVIV